MSNHTEESALADVMYFVYFSLKGELSAVDLHHVSVSDTHIQGFLHGDKSSFRTYRRDRVVDIVDSAQQLPALYQAVYEQLQHKITDKDFEHRVHPVHTFDVHFTGFKKADKQALIALADHHNMVVRKDVTKYLNLLCYGYNASLRKLDLAREQNVIIVNEPQFKAFVETGEIPEVQ